MADRQQSERRGRGAETLAMIWLRLTGHRVLARRWRGRGGEIDIVAYRRQVIIFCEVKFRRWAGDTDIPSPQQRRRICRAGIRITSACVRQCRMAVRSCPDFATFAWQCLAASPSEGRMAVR